VACGGTKGNPNPDPLLAKSPKSLRENVIEHAVGRSGVPDNADFVPYCSTSLGYESEGVHAGQALFVWRWPPTDGTATHQQFRRVGGVPTWR